MGRFATTVPYYRRFRQPYPREFFRGIAGVLRLDGTQTLVDLGCGPAPLALGFAPHVRGVVGVDPEPDMIAAARAAAEEAGVPLMLYECRAEEVPETAGTFAVATIGRALHWMEPAPTCAVLDRLVPAGGAVVVCAAYSAEEQNPWLPAYEALRDSLRTEGPRAKYRQDVEVFFAGSPFAVRDRFEARTQQTISVDVLAGRLLSMSVTSRAVLGARAERVADEVRAALAPFLGPGGTLAEVVEARATLLARPR